MPSYRLLLDVLDARPGVAPPDVLPRAAAVVGTRRRVEDRRLLLVDGRPRLQIRFLVEVSNDAAEDAEAVTVAWECTEEIAAQVCLVGDWELRRRDGRAPGGWPLVLRREAHDPGW